MILRLQHPMVQSFSKIPAVAGLLLMVITFAACHLDAGIAATQLTHSVWVLLFSWMLPLPRRFYTAEFRFVLALVALFFTSLLSAWLAGDFENPTYFRPAFIYLYAIGALGVLSLFTLRKSWLIFGLLFAVSMASLVIVKDFLYGGVRGEHHGLAIPYGIFGLTTGLVCLLFVTDKTLSKLTRMLLFFGAVGGFAACVWSQTRIAWIYGVLWILVALVGWLLGSNFSRNKKILFIAVAGVILSFSLSQSSIIQSRVSEAVNDVTSYVSGSNKNTSIGQRFELWKVALRAIERSPITGVGESGFVQLRNEMTRSKEVFVRKNLEHAHNEYLWIAATHGVISLAIYLILQIGLLVFYWKNLVYENARILSLAGLTLTSGALFYGMSDIFFSIKISIGYYLIAQMVLIRFVCQFRTPEGVVKEL